MKHRQRGFTLTEVLIASSLIAIALVPLLQALQSIGTVAGANVTMLQQQLQLTGRMESLLAEEYADLLAAAAAANDPTAPTTYSDAAGTEPRTLVQISFYDVDDLDGDGNPFTIADPDTDNDNNPYTGGDVVIDLLWIKTSHENHHYALETLTAP